MNFRNFLKILVLFIVLFLILLVIEYKIGILITFILVISTVLILNLLNKRERNIDNIVKYGDKEKINIVYNIVIILGLFICAFVIRIVLSKILLIRPVSDFERIVNASLNLAKGNNILNTSSYFLCWAYQTAFVLYQSVIIKIFKDIYALTVLNCIYASISCVFIYLISNKIYKNKIASIISAFMYIIGFYVSAFCGVLSNQHLFTMLVLISIYILILVDKISIKTIFLIGVLLALANLVRPEAIIYLVAMLGYIFFHEVENIKDVKNVLLKSFILISTYFLIIRGAGIIIQQTNINKNGLSNQNVLWKFVLGLDHESGGRYSSKSEKIFNNQQKQIDWICMNLKKPLSSHIELINYKLHVFWNINDYNWVLQDEIININNKTLYKAPLIDIVSKYDDIIFYIVLYLLMINLINNILKRNVQMDELLCLFIIAINTITYLIIENQSRYAYTAKIFIYILSTGGISYIIDKIKYKIVKNKRKDIVKND